jgi:hypothetical protein
MMAKNRIVTGLCFPKTPIDNQYPHLTLMVNKWSPVYSNHMINAVLKKNQEWAHVYEKLRANKVKELEYVYTTK